MDAKEIEKFVQESVRNRKPVPDYPKPDPWFCEITALYLTSHHPIPCDVTDIILRGFDIFLNVKMPFKRPQFAVFPHPVNE